MMPLKTRPCLALPSPRNPVPAAPYSTYERCEKLAIDRLSMMVYVYNDKIRVSAMIRDAMRCNAMMVVFSYTCPVCKGVVQ